MAEREACLVDVYDTLVSCDFVSHRSELPALAGLTAQAWGAGYSQFSAAFGLGQMSKADGFGRILRESGAQARPELVRALVELDRELLLRSARLYDDALPFLRGLRSEVVEYTAAVSPSSWTIPEMTRTAGLAEASPVLVQLF